MGSTSDCPSKSFISKELTVTDSFTLMNLHLKTSFTGVAIALSLIHSSPGAEIAPKHGLNNVSHDQVQLEGGFWGPRLEIHHKTNIPHVLDALERNGHVTNFDKAAGKFDGELCGNHAFDSDIHKAMEGAMYTLHHVDDPELQQRAKTILDRIIAAQQDDGFLISYFIVKGLDQKWDDLRLKHQMYNAGHFFELAVEHNRLTGKTYALNAAKKFADHIDGIFGLDKRHDVGGHQGIEIALIKLYRATGEKRYLDLCRFLLDERGCQHNVSGEHKRYDPNAPVSTDTSHNSTTADNPHIGDGVAPVDEKRAAWFKLLRTRNGRMQDHKPLIEQAEAVGHAVRAGYIYSAMADIARFSDAPEYRMAAEKLWQDVVSRKMYVNGAIGTNQYSDEGFGDPYLLPNKTYAESCSSIAHLFWQHRMNLLTGEAKYADVMELVLYNAALSGMSLSGDKFFYQNPLESQKGSERNSWISIACCPTNLARFTPQVGGYIYARNMDQLFVNLYAAGETSIEMNGSLNLKLRQETNYPWDGKIKLTVSPEQESEFDLCVRIPGWALGKPVPSDLYRFGDREVLSVTLSVNGEFVAATPGTDGYVHLKRFWKDGDIVELELPMALRRVYAHEKIIENEGKVALMRGPIVYCFEGADNKDIDLFEARLPRTAELSSEYRSDLLGGVTLIHGKGLDENQNPVNLSAIPYYAWSNREKGPMTLWIDETKN